MAGRAVSGINTIFELDLGGGFLPIAGMREFDIDYGENQTMEDDDLTSTYADMCPLGRTNAGSFKGALFFDPASPTQFALNNVWNVGGGNPTTPTAPVDGRITWPVTPARTQPLKLILQKLPIKVNRTEGISQDAEFVIAQRPVLDTV